MSKHMFTTKSMTPQAKYIPHKIFDEINYRNVGISFWDHQTLQEITHNSGPHAYGNEFQVHYWALNLRKEFTDGSIFDLSFPVVLFNYEQQVSTASIDFEMKDVEEISNALVPLVNKEFAALEPLLKAYNELDFKLISTSLNSLHRHPGGRVQSFSGTDLNTNHTYNTGIVFPLATGTNTANFASIIAIVDGITYMAHSEYRIANGDLTEQGLLYEQGRCVSYIRADPYISSEAEKLFSIPNKDQKYIVTKGIDVKHPFIEKLTSIWDSLNYKPNTQFIKPENVTEQVVKAYTYNQPNWLQSNQTLKKETAPVTTPLYKQDINWYNSVVAEINKTNAVVMLSIHAISQLTMPERIEYMNRLEQYYYGKAHIDKADKYDRVELNDIHEMHDCIIEEFLGLDQIDDDIAKDEYLDDFINEQMIYARGG